MYKHTGMLTEEEIARLRRSAKEADLLIRAELKRLKARSIAQEIADLEDAIGRMNVADATDVRFAAVWELQEKIDRLRGFARLREPAIDEDCRTAGCGSYGRSIF